MSKLTSLADLLRRVADRIDGTGVDLRLTATGPGSRPEIVDYVRTAIERNTLPLNDDAAADKLARAITTSVLHRLGAGYSVSTGGLPVTEDAS